MKLENLQHSRLITPDEYSRIPHMIMECDFSTEYPNPYRIERIAKELEVYLKHRNSMIEGDNL